MKTIEDLVKNVTESQFHKHMRGDGHIPPAHTHGRHDRHDFCAAHSAPRCFPKGRTKDDCEQKHCCWSELKHECFRRRISSMGKMVVWLPLALGVILICVVSALVVLQCGVFHNRVKYGSRVLASSGRNRPSSFTPLPTSDMCSPMPMGEFPVVQAYPVDIVRPDTRPLRTE